MSDIRLLAIADIPAGIFGFQLYEAKVPCPAGPGTWDVGSVVFSACRGVHVTRTDTADWIKVQQIRPCHSNDHFPRAMLVLSDFESLKTSACEEKRSRMTGPGSLHWQISLLAAEKMVVTQSTNNLCDSVQYLQIVWS